MSCMPDKRPVLPTIRKFLLTIAGDWGSLVSGILSVPFTYLAVVAASDRTKIIYALLALSGILIATYRVWAKERRALVE